MNDDAKPDRLALLDGLRGLAALLVLFYHVNSIHGEKGFVFGQGILAVDFFFLLSGFVIARAFEGKFARGLGVMDFMKLRAIRLWPALAVGIVLGAVAHSILTPSLLVLPLIALSMLMIPVFIPNGGYFLLVAVQWSLLLELFANLMHVLLLRRLPARGLMLVVVVSGLAFLHGIATFGTTGVGGDTPSFAYGFARVLFGYGLGILMARRHGDRAPRRTGWGAILASLVVIICGVSMIPEAWRLVGQIVAVFAAFPVVLRLAVDTGVPRRAEPALLWLGAISYPIYAIHYPIFFIAADVNALLFPSMNKRLWDMIAIAAVLLLAHGMAMAGGWFRQRRQASPAQRASKSIPPARRRHLKEAWSDLTE